MPQGTIKHYDHDTHTGTLVTDTLEEHAFDAETFAESGLIELRLGQRVRFEVGDGEGRARVHHLRLVSL